MFATAAYAQAAGGQAAGGGAIQLLFPLIIVVIFYFFLLRPQQKRMKEHKAMIEALRRGDQVLTAGGIIGKVSKVGDNGELEVEIADGVKVKIARHTITQVMNKTEPAKS